MSKSDGPRLVSYGEARRRIQDLDLLLFETPGIRGKAMGIAGRGKYTHAAKAVWWPSSYLCSGTLLACETIEGTGGRLIPLSRYVKEYGGAIDVFKLCTTAFPEYDVRKATDWMIRNIPGVAYGRWALLRIALSHLPIIRAFVRPSNDNLAQSGRLPVCSAAVARVDRRGGGVDPVPNLADDAVEPNDLAKSLLYRFAFRIKKDEGHGKDPIA